MENVLIQKVEKLRSKMIASIEKNGLQSQTTLKLSQQLDQVIIEIQKFKKSYL